MRTIQLSLLDAIELRATEEGEQLKDEAVTIPQRLAGCLNLDGESAAQLYTILHKLMESF